MAEKPEINKSQAIRDYFKLNPTAKAQEVVDALAKKDITVSVGLVNTVKSANNQKQAAKRATKKAAKTPATKQPAEAPVAAKQPGVSKTQAVRDYLKANKRAKTSEVVDALAKQGITITVGYVRTIKAKKSRRRRVMKQIVENVVAEGVVGIPQIKAAFAFVKTVGSIAMAKEALAAAVEIKKVV